MSDLTTSEMLDELENSSYDGDIYSLMIDHWREDWDGLDIDEKTRIFKLMTKTPMDDEIADKWDDWTAEWWARGDNSKEYRKERDHINNSVRTLTEKPLGANGRAFVESFVTDPDRAMAILQAENPELENIRWRNGRIVGNKPGEDFDRVLNPEVGEFTDTFNDIAGGAYGVLEIIAPAVAQGLTTVAAKSPAAGATVGGIVAGGLDTFKQWMGEDDVDPYQSVAVGVGQTVLGGAGPSLRVAKKFPGAMAKAGSAMGVGVPMAGLKKASEFVAKRRAIKEAGREPASPNLYDLLTKGVSPPKPPGKPPIPPKEVLFNMGMTSLPMAGGRALFIPGLQPPIDDEYESSAATGIRPVTK